MANSPSTIAGGRIAASAGPASTPSIALAPRGLTVDATRVAVVRSRCHHQIPPPSAASSTTTIAARTRYASALAGNASPTSA